MLLAVVTFPHWAQSILPAAEIPHGPEWPGRRLVLARDSNRLVKAGPLLVLTPRPGIKVAVLHLPFCKPRHAPPTTPAATAPVLCFRRWLPARAGLWLLAGDVFFNPPRLHSHRELFRSSWGSPVGRRGRQSRIRTCTIHRPANRQGGKVKPKGGRTIVMRWSPDQVDSRLKRAGTPPA